jgi:transposase
VETQMFVEIDVSKAKLDVALRPGAESFSVTNNQRSVATLVKRLEKLCESCIVLEANGGYEITAANELAAAGLLVAAVSPRQVRDFARATGRLAKTVLERGALAPITLRSTLPHRSSFSAP